MRANVARGIDQARHRGVAGRIHNVRPGLDEKIGAKLRELDIYDRNVGQDGRSP